MALSPVDIAIALLILVWLIGVIFHILGRFIHLILIIALVLIVARVMQATGIFDPFQPLGL